MEEKETTLKDEIKKLNENFTDLVAQKKAKNWRMPFSGRVSKKKTKEGYASICYIQDNKDAKFMKMPITDGAIMIDNVPHLATPEFALTYKGKPFMIVPSWNTKPFSPERDYEDAMRAKTTSYGYRLLLNTMKGELIKAKAQISAGVIIAILAVLGIGGYFLTRGGGITG